MKVEQVEMTPTRARELLGASAGARQRTLQRKRVDRWIHAIHSGQWKLTHQGIAVDAAGIVIDGQHRLTAIAEAGRTVPILLASEADPDTFDVIDTGLSRSPSQALQIAGYANSNQLAAASRMFLGYQRIRGTTDLPGSYMAGLTSTDVIGFLESERGETILQSMRPAAALATLWGRVGMRTWLTCSIAILHDDGAPPELIETFTDRLGDGAMLSQGSPILALRRFAMSPNGLARVASQNRAQNGEAVFIKAWNGWVTGSVRQLVAFRTAQEKMPEPIIPGRAIRMESDGFATYAPADVDAKKIAEQDLLLQDELELA